MMPALALLFFTLQADAREIVLSAAGGRDYSTDQFWTGLDAAILPDKERGWSGYGRLTPAWGFADAFPFLSVEAGVFAALPREGEIVRIGLIASTLVLGSRFRLPVQFGQGDRYWGLIPGIEAAAEFEFFEEKQFIVGVRLGVRPASSNYLCPTPDDVERCLSWFPGATGGFYARGKLTSWLYLSGIIGPSPQVALGYAF